MSGGLPEVQKGKVVGGGFIFWWVVAAGEDEWWVARGAKRKGGWWWWQLEKMSGRLPEVQKGKGRVGWHMKKQKMFNKYGRQKRLKRQKYPLY